MQLFAILRYLRVPNQMYDLCMGDNMRLDVCDALEYTDHGWEVYTTERGGKYDVRVFDNETNTCMELIELAKRVQAQQAEAQTVEVKAAHRGCPNKLRDTLSSFSNQNSGGVLLFGLDENEHFAAVGVYDLQDLQKKVTEQCNQMQPPVCALFTAAEYEGVWICSAEIPSVAYAERPCYYIGAGIQNGSYVRVGDADRHMTDYEIYCFEAYRNHMHDDERVIERATVDFLDKDLLNAFLTERRVSRPQFAQMNDTQAMEML